MGEPSGDHPRSATGNDTRVLGVKGVWVTRYGKYAAEIRGAGQKTYLDCFATLEEANAAYAKAAKKAFGSFAPLADIARCIAHVRL
jgi:hypothetical protein